MQDAKCKMQKQLSNEVWKAPATLAIASGPVFSMSSKVCPKIRSGACSTSIKISLR